MIDLTVKIDNEEAKKKFLGWYYPDYGKEN